MTLLLHVCCGPCATAIIQDLQRRGCAVTAFFYNPNIQPAEEKTRRLDSLRKYLTKIGIPLIIVDSNEKDFIAATRSYPNTPERCRACYRLRLDETARVAASRGFDFFTTTLLSSPHQDIEAIKMIGDELAVKYHLKFYAPDSGRKKFKGFRPLFTAGRKISHAEHLYEQTYCGCLKSRTESQSI